MTLNSQNVCWNVCLTLSLLCIFIMNQNDVINLMREKIFSAHHHSLSGNPLTDRRIEKSEKLFFEEDFRDLGWDNGSTDVCGLTTLGRPTIRLTNKNLYPIQIENAILWSCYYDFLSWWTFVPSRICTRSSRKGFNCCWCKRKKLCCTRGWKKSKFTHQENFKSTREKISRSGRLAVRGFLDHTFKCNIWSHLWLQ